MKLKKTLASSPSPSLTHSLHPNLLPFIHQMQLLRQMFHGRFFPKDSSVVVVKKSRAKRLVSSVQDLIHEALEAAILGRSRRGVWVVHPLWPCSRAHCLLNGVIMPASSRFRFLFLDQAVRRAHLLIFIVFIDGRPI